MKKLFLSSVFGLFGICCYGQYNQNTNVNQNTTVIHNFPITERVIEKPIYIEKYRTVYVDRPAPRRIARRLSAPLVLHGYLYVYTEDIGNFKSQRDALEIIENINRQAPFGRNNWRIPTSAELAVMEQNAAAVGLGDDIYIATDHANGVLRMVSTGPNVAEQNAEAERLAAEQQAEAARLAAERQAEAARAAQAEAQRIAEEQKRVGVLINGVRWAVCNVGTRGTFVANLEDYGNQYTFEEAKSACPFGWRLPTKSEIESLSNVNYVHTTRNGIEGCLFGNGNSTIFMPLAGGNSLGGSGRHGAYWSSGPSTNTTMAYSLYFAGDGTTPPFPTYRTDRLRIRCVRE
jgi:uncharacterized protein (TIGR02145 family)